MTERRSRWVVAGVVSLVLITSASAIAAGISLVQLSKARRDLQALQGRVSGVEAASFVNTSNLYGARQDAQQALTTAQAAQSAAETAQAPPTQTRA
jgi:hypothetical protein